MFRKVRLWGVVAVITALSLLGVSAAMAGTGIGTGPDSATGPATGPVQLATGAQQWYAFSSSQAPSDAKDTQIMIELSANPQGSASFSVWTAAGARAMLAGDTSVLAVGNGTTQSIKDTSGNTTTLFNGDPIWVGNSKNAASYFVVVQSNSTSPSSYTLKITGNYISFPAAAAASQPAAQGASSSGAELPPPLVLPSTGQNQSTTQSQSQAPLDAFAISGQARTLGAGQQEWIPFQYNELNAAGNYNTISVLLMANPNVSFSIWNSIQVRNMQGGSTTEKSVGNGSLHPESSDTSVDRFAGNLFWSGALVNAGTYWIQVQNHGSTPAGYTLQVTQQ